MPKRDVEVPITVTILIPCHNEEAMIASCIDSCLNQTRKPDQILVINDGSTDNSKKILENYGGKISLINIPIATGNKSKAQEIGLRSVTSSIVISTDGDTVLDTKFLESIVKEFTQDPQLSVVAGYVESMRYNTMTALREIDYTVGQDIHKLAQSYLNFLLVVPGCAGAFKTDLFRNGTLTFDHDTLTEDLDLTYKLNKADLSIKYSKQAKVYTQDPPTLQSYINQMRRWYGGAWQNFKKHKKILKNKPNAAFILSMSYFEGLFFGTTIFLLPLINFLLFIKIFFGYILICIAMGLYASLRKKYIKLLLVSPLMAVLTIINAYIFLEQFIFEIVFQKKNMAWYHPERRIIYADKTDNLINI